MFILLGILGLMGIVGAQTFVALAAPSWVARALGVGSFRLFDVQRSSPSVWKEIAIGIAGSLAPIFVASGLFIVSSLVGGDLVTPWTWRIARLRQVLNGLLLFGLLSIPLVLATTLLEMDDHAILFLPHAWLSPVLFPVAWLLASSLWGRAKGALFVASLTLPCLNFAALFALSLHARAYLNENGLANAGIVPSSPLR